ncbi:MAG: hypothetical protein R3257_01770, partial [bacterium]|nr:hypothetical protein [bacterium]
DDGFCVAPAVQDIDVNNRPICAYPKNNLQAAGSIEDLTLADGSPDLEKYFYDETRGLLFFNVAQDRPNAVGPSPLGSCTEGASPGEDPTCPDVAEGESYYACPPEGCVDYVVHVNDPTYDPGPSNCEAYPTYAEDPPPGELLLAHLGSSDFVDRVEKGGRDSLFPHYEAAVAPNCPHTLVAGVDPIDGSSFGLEKFIETGVVPDPPHCPPPGNIGGGGCSLQSSTTGSWKSIWLFFLPLGLFFLWKGLSLGFGLGLRGLRRGNFP